jgi:ribosomal protein S10
MYLDITISSKNNSSLKSFLNAFKTLSQCDPLRLNKTLTVFQKKRFKKVFTILKSPHVYKTAQEQFESSLFAKTLKIQTYQQLKTLVILKKMQTVSFADIQIKIKLIINLKCKKKMHVNYLKQKIPRLTRRHVRYIRCDEGDIKLKNSVVSYLFVFNLYGKTCFNNHLNSSVGRAKD